jgi:hypothetical protein
MQTATKVSPIGEVFVQLAAISLRKEMIVG